MDIEELLHLERQGWDTLCRGTGAGFYGRLMTPAAVMVLAHGMVMDRDAVIASLDEAPPWDRYTITEPRLVEVEADTALLVYKGVADRGDVRFEALMSSLYTRIDASWRLVLHQQTRVPEDS